MTSLMFYRDLPNQNIAPSKSCLLFNLSHLEALWQETVSTFYLCNLTFSFLEGR